MAELTYRESVTLLQNEGYTDQVSQAINLADLVALRVHKATGQFPVGPHDCLGLFLRTMAELVQETIEWEMDAARTAEKGPEPCP